MIGELTVKTKSFREFRKLVKLIYNMGYAFYNDKKYNPFLMWVGFHGLNDIAGIYFYNFDNCKRIKFCDYSDWENKDYIEFNEFLRLIHGEV